MHTVSGTLNLGGDNIEQNVKQLNLEGVRSRKVFVDNGRLDL